MGDDYAKVSSGGMEPRTYPANLMLGFNKATTVLESTDVLGVLEGTDLKDQYVFVTAHYDHLGKRDTVIYYGADDDGSGTAGVLEIAEAFAKACRRYLFKNLAVTIPIRVSSATNNGI